MAEKEPVIVIKKIYPPPAGGHGGSWKVAFADFMTAMMAFFLLMWLLNQTDEVKKNVADYFSTPSIIEYNFSNYGVELTLEKLFLDLINEPLKFFQAFITPADNTPNLMAMGSKKVVLAHITDELSDFAENLTVNSDEILFEIPDRHLFKPGTAEPAVRFVYLMEKVKAVTAGLEESDIFIDSNLYIESVRGQSSSLAKAVAEERLDLVSNKIQGAKESDSVDIFGKINVKHYTKSLKESEKPAGSIKIRIKQKDSLNGGRKTRKLDDLFGKTDQSMPVYDDFVKQLTEQPNSDKATR